MNLAGWPQRLKVINVYFTQQRDVRKQIVTIRRDAKYIGKNKTKQNKSRTTYTQLKIINMIID